MTAIAIPALVPEFNPPDLDGFGVVEGANIGRVFEVLGFNGLHYQHHNLTCGCAQSYLSSICSTPFVVKRSCMMTLLVS